MFTIQVKTPARPYWHDDRHVGPVSEWEAVELVRLITKWNLGLSRVREWAGKSSALGNG